MAPTHRVVEIGDEAIARSGEDDDTVLRVRSDGSKDVRQLTVRGIAPHERPALGVQADHKNPGVVTLEHSMLEPIRVVLEVRWHQIRSVAGTCETRTRTKPATSAAWKLPVSVWFLPYQRFHEIHAVATARKLVGLDGRCCRDPRGSICAAQSMCPERESNPHAPHGAGGFKPPASTVPPPGPGAARLRRTGSVGSRWDDRWADGGGGSTGCSTPARRSSTRSQDNVVDPAWKRVTEGESSIPADRRHRASRSCSRRRSRRGSRTGRSGS